MDQYYTALREVVAIEVNDKLEVGASQVLLGRNLTRTTMGFEIRVGEALLDSIFEKMGLNDKSKIQQLPGNPGDRCRPCEDSLLSAEQHKQYRTVVGKLLFLANERPDMQYIVKELSRSVKGPTVHDEARLKRACRYLLWSRDVCLQLHPVNDAWPETAAVVGFTDSDWAKDPKERRSTSGGVLQVYGATVLTYSRTQPVISLSSAESELYALSSLVGEARGLVQFLEELGTSVHLEVHCDSSAAIAVSARLGPGKMKHILLRHLWIQQMVRDGMLSVKKISSNNNCADVLTKVPKEKGLFFKLCAIIGVHLPGDREEDASRGGHQRLGNSARLQLIGWLASLPLIAGTTQSEEWLLMSSQLATCRMSQMSTGSSQGDSMQSTRGYSSWVIWFGGIAVTILILVVLMLRYIQKPVKNIEEKKEKKEVANIGTQTDTVREGTQLEHRVAVTLYGRSFHRIDCRCLGQGSIRVLTACSVCTPTQNRG